MWVEGPFASCKEVLALVGVSRDFVNEVGQYGG